MLLSIVLNIEEDEVDVEINLDDEDNGVPDALDPYDKVYANVPSETHKLEAVENCEHCNAKKFEYETPGFCCRSGKIHLSTPDTPPKLMRFWTALDAADARHFRSNIRFFNGHFSFTSLYCHLDRMTTNMRNRGVYTFRAHGQIYHNVRSFGKEDGAEPRHLELYFHDDDPSLELRYRRCREECLRKDNEVIDRLVAIIRGNPYFEHFRTMGAVDNLEDYHVELNLDQRLDQRTYSVPITSEVAEVWIEGSERHGQFEHSVVLQGKDRSIHGIRSYHGCYDVLSYPLFFPRGELGRHNCIPKVGVTAEQVNAAREVWKVRAGGEDLGTLSDTYIYCLF